MFGHLLASALLACFCAYAQTSSLVKIDMTTQGNWTGVYGSDGYSIPNYKTILPNYLPSLAMAGFVATYTWASNPTASQALVTTPGSRIASCWYYYTPNPGIGSFSTSFNFSGTTTHQVAIYFDDYDGYGGGRTETVTASATVTGAVLSMQTLTKFGAGVWLVYSMSGAVTVTVAGTNSKSNAVLNGVFFDTPNVSGQITIQVNGVTKGVGSTLNFLSGNGIIVGCGVLGTTLNCQFDADSAVLLSLLVDIGNANHTLTAGSPTNPGITYTATTVVPLPSYAPGQEFILFPDKTNLAGATLDLGLGPVALKKYSAATGLVPVTGGECIGAVDGPPPVPAIGCKIRELGDSSAWLVE